MLRKSPITYKAILILVLINGFSFVLLAQLSEDFESYTNGTWPSTWVADGNGTDITTNYIDATSSSGTKSLRIFGTLGGCWGALGYRSLNISAPFVVDVILATGDEPLTGCHPDRAGFGLRQGTSWSNPARNFVQFMGDGTIQSGGGTVALGTYSTLTWYNIRVLYERPTSLTVKLSYWVNNLFMGSETLDAIAEEDQLTNLQIVVQEGSAWFDKIEVNMNLGENCSNPVTITGNSGSEPYSTTGYFNDYTGSGGGTGEDKIFYLESTISNGDTLEFWTSGDDYDVVLYGRYGSCTGIEIGWLNDLDGTVLTWENTTGVDQNVWLFVDGWSGSDGNGTLNWNIKKGYPNLEYNSHTIDDDSITSIGNNNLIVEPGETIEMPLTLINTGTKTANNVVAVLSTTDPDIISISDDTEDFGTIAAGSTATSSFDYDFEVSPTALSHDVTFTLNITSVEGSWTDDFTVSIANFGEDCSNPVIIAGTAGAESYSTTGYIDDYTGSGSGGTGEDIVFYLETPVPNGYYLKFNIAADDYDVILYGRYGSCTGSEIGWVDDPDGSTITWVNNTGIEQNVWMFVDGWNGSDGSGWLVWSIMETLKPGEDCSNSNVLSGTSGSYIYSTTGYFNDYRGVSGGTGEDQVFLIDTAIPDGNTIEFWTSEDDYDVVLYGRYGSCTGTEIGWLNDPDGDTLTWENNTGVDQNVWLFVDGWSGSNGTGTLNWNIVALANSGEDCSTPLLITGTSGSVAYTTTGYTNDYPGSGGASGADKVYYLDTPVSDGQSFKFWTSADDYDVVLYGRYGSCTGTEIGWLNDPDGDTLIWENNTDVDQNIWLFVDGWNGSSGSGTLNWKIDTIASANINEPPTIVESRLPDKIEYATTSKVSYIKVVDDSPFLSVKFYYKTLFDQDFNKELIVSPDIWGVYGIDINKAWLGSEGIMQYYYWVTDGEFNDSTRVSTIVIEYNDSNSPKISNLGSGGNPSDWKMFSIPYTLSSNRIENIFSGLEAYDNTRWRLVHYKNDQEEFIEYGSKLRTIERGKSYWFNSLTPAVAQVGAGTTPFITEANLFTINLVSGWNQIGNPYTFDVLWSDIIAYNKRYNNLTNQVEGYLRAFNSGKLSNEAVLRAHGGAYLMASKAFSLKIPLIKAPTGSRVLEANEYDEGWFVNINLESGEFSNTVSGIGMHHNAQLSKDYLDQLVSPQFVKYIDASFSHPEYFMPNFARDIVPVFDNYVWEFEVTTNINDEVRHLRWSDIEFPGGQRLKLVDLTNNRVVDMLENNHYSYSNDIVRKFKIIYGDESFFLKQFNENSIYLGENYPNPFNNTTTIPYNVYGMESNYKVRINIYSINGTLVTTLVDEIVTPGNYTVEWNGMGNSRKKLAGMYIYSLEVVTAEGIKSFRKKMISY